MNLVSADGEPGRSKSRGTAAQSGCRDLCVAVKEFHAFSIRGMPFAKLTDALNVTDFPKVDGFRLEVMAVVVCAGLTT
jgi:hypothetical protein